MRAIILVDLPEIGLKEGDDVEVTRAQPDFCLTENPSGQIVQVPYSALRLKFEPKAKASTGQSLNPARFPVSTNIEEV